MGSSPEKQLQTSTTHSKGRPRREKPTTARTPGNPSDAAPSMATPGSAKGSRVANSANTQPKTPSSQATTTPKKSAKKKPPTVSDASQGVSDAIARQRRSSVPNAPSVPVLATSTASNMTPSKKSLANPPKSLSTNSSNSSQVPLQQQQQQNQSKQSNTSQLSSSFQDRLYAGANFQNAPAPSDLPIPVFSSATKGTNSLTAPSPAATGSLSTQPESPSPPRFPLSAGNNPSSSFSLSYDAPSFLNYNKNTSATVINNRNSNFMPVSVNVNGFFPAGASVHQPVYNGTVSNPVAMTGHHQVGYIPGSVTMTHQNNPHHMTPVKSFPAPPPHKHTGVGEDDGAMFAMDNVQTSSSSDEDEGSSLQRRVNHSAAKPGVPSPGPNFGFNSPIRDRQSNQQPMRLSQPQSENLGNIGSFQASPFQSAVPLGTSNGHYGPPTPFQLQQFQKLYPYPNPPMMHEQTQPSGMQQSPQMFQQISNPFLVQPAFMSGNPQHQSMSHQGVDRMPIPQYSGAGMSSSAVIGSGGDLPQSKHLGEMAMNLKTILKINQ
ncbi:hypothetical protein HDU78_009885 [Chytriomyces hyalinus]|nr:hypothetical protein HDU78_009885 [Chytriomyces hyalinus]